MDGYISLISWSPSSIASGVLSDASLFIIVIMAFIGASVITRLANVDTSFNFSVNFAVMLGGCLAVHSWTSEVLLPVSNDLVASAVSANFGMTLAGFVLLFSYRNNV